MPPALFTVGELETFMRVPAGSLTPEPGGLALELVTIEIRSAVGAALYDSLTDVTPYKAIALTVAKRGLINPEGMRSQSESIDDYQYTNQYATETLGSYELTPAEVATIQQRSGLTAAFSIAPAIPATYPRRGCCTGGCRRCRPLISYI